MLRGTTICSKHDEAIEQLQGAIVELQKVTIPDNIYLSEIENLLSALDKQRYDLIIALLGVKSTISDAKVDGQSMEDGLLVKKDKIEELGGEISTLEKDLDNARNKIADLQDEINTLEDELNHLQPEEY